MTGSLPLFQDNFSQGVASGLTQSYDYKAAGYCENMSPDAIYVEASRLMDNPKVSLRIAELKLAVTEASTTAAAWTLDKQVSESASNLLGARKDHQWGAANGALANIGKLTGMLVDRHEIAVDHQVHIDEDVLLALIARKRELEAGIIDV